MPTGVELDSLLYGNLRSDVGSRNGLSLCLEQTVQVGDVGLVVFAVVQLHDLSGNVRLQCLPSCEYVNAE